jgi:hypothetical protein
VLVTENDACDFTTLKDVTAPQRARYALRRGSLGFMSSIYDLPEIYDAVLQRSPEVIEAEVASIRRLLAERGITAQSRCGTRTFRAIWSVERAIW